MTYFGKQRTINERYHDTVARNRIPTPSAVVTPADLEHADSSVTEARVLLDEFLASETLAGVRQMCTENLRACVRGRAERLPDARAVTIALSMAEEELYRALGRAERRRDSIAVALGCDLQDGPE